jgi:peptide/nickel transport system ATP-binding protein
MLKDSVIQEAGRTASVFSSPKSAYARKLYADVPALNPDRYAGLRDPASVASGFATARHRRSRSPPSRRPLRSTERR